MLHAVLFPCSVQGQHVLHEHCRNIYHSQSTRGYAILRLCQEGYSIPEVWCDSLLRVLSGSCRFVELHGDRAGLDDPAMVCGLASMDGISFMFIGHQKGRNTKVPCCRHPMLCTSKWPGTWAIGFLAL